MDRGTAPTLQPVTAAQLVQPEPFQLANGVHVYTLPGGAQPICQFDLVFPAGKWYESEKAAAFFTARLLKEGTKSYTSEELANELDYLGASLSCQSTSDFLQVTAYSLSKHVPRLLELLKEVLFHPTFPEAELELRKKIQLQKLAVSEQKVEYLATKAFFGQLFGSHHPYGYRMGMEDVEALSRNTLVGHYHGTVAQAPFFVVAAGQLSNNIETLLNDALGTGNPDKLQWTPVPDHGDAPSGPDTLHVPKENAQQSALRVGRPLFNFTHPDYKSLKILNTILGGYFGSRLMSNIREDKGYTYGIHSAVHGYLHGGLFYISTEVGSQYQEPALKEIRHELVRLQEEPVPVDELNLVKQYLLGNILGSIDGPLKSAAALKELIATGQTADDFNEFIGILQSIEPMELITLAERYLDPESMTTVVAGNPEMKPA